MALKEAAMARSGTIALALSAVFAALLALSACAQPAHNGPQPTHDDTRDVDHPDRGMRDNHMM
jgi:hypothetical protein